MPSPPNYRNSLRMVSGQTKVLEVTVKTCEGAAASLLNGTMYFTVRDDVGGTVLVQLYSPDNGVTITDAGAGLATITIPSDSALTSGCYVYDVWVEFPGTPPVRYPVVKKAELVVEPAVVSFP